MNPAPDTRAVPIPRISHFVRQVAHDVRNGLNAIDLEATFIAEIADDAEVVAEAKKLRAIVGGVAKNLQTLAAKFSEPRMNAILLGARDFAEAFRERGTQRLGEKASETEWEIELGQEHIQVDFEMLSAALHEILSNAFQFRDGEGAVRVRVFAEDRNVVFEVTEPKQGAVPEPEAWGEPLSSTCRGHYGLGLFHASRIVGGHHGTMQARQENGHLTTRVTLPIEPAES
ncbi:MAG: hypothetical protein QOD99_2879 [Chthoniobacter sp.]|jgi:signal transduction histidine kinase|nr:hypothetical protein [Chthoniobacter sp.]